VRERFNEGCAQFRSLQFKRALEETSPLFEEIENGVLREMSPALTNFSTNSLSE
jgi:septation ring formation regulator EzrA